VYPSFAKTLQQETDDEAVTAHMEALDLPHWYAANATAADALWASGGRYNSPQVQPF